MVLAFFLCWAPFHAQRLGYVYFKESKIFRTLNEYLYYISGFLYYLSATVNPILYNLMSLKYRHAFKQTLCGRKRRRAQGGTTNRQPSAQRTYNFRNSNFRNGESSPTFFLEINGNFILSNNLLLYLRKLVLSTPVNLARLTINFLKNVISRLSV